MEMHIELAFSIKYVESQVKWLSTGDDCKRFSQGAVKETT